MRYVLGAKTAVKPSKYATAMLIMSILATGLMIFDIHEMGVIIYALSGLK